MRDIRLGKARLMVPQSYLDNIGRGKGAVFEPEREVFLPVAMLVSGEAAIGASRSCRSSSPSASRSTSRPVNASSRRSSARPGTRGQTLGLQGDIAQTATEVVARERKSLTTRGKKITYWRPGLRTSCTA